MSSEREWPKIQPGTGKAGAMKQPVFSLKEAFAVFLVGTLLAVTLAHFLIGTVMSVFGR